MVSHKKNVRIYYADNVHNESLRRIRRIFDEFDEVVVNSSGGKDSTVLFYLAMRVAQERGRTPLKVFWLDQEIEWEATVELQRTIMYREDVEPLWFQIPFYITNATSDEHDFLFAWDPDNEDKWMRPRDEISFKENIYGSKKGEYCDFVSLFDLIQKEHFKDKRTAILTGMRAEESLQRFSTMTKHLGYKDTSWSSHVHKGIYRFSPIYDWATSDIWKCIHDNGLPYNRVYDGLFRLGFSPRYMRISNLNHESAYHQLFRVQEIEPDTHDRICARLEGTHSATRLGNEDYIPKKLPPMFKDWREYRDFLLEKLVHKERHKKGFKRIFLKQDLMFEHHTEYDKVVRDHIKAIMTNDWEGEKAIHNTTAKLWFPENVEIRKAKEQYLKDIGLWDQLIEEGIISR